MALIGYARVSTDKQTMAAQIDALEAVGCERIFQETASGAKRDRPLLHAAIDYMRPGDVLVVWKLDRLARSMLQLSEIVDRLGKSGMGFRCLSQSFDTTTAGGKMIFGVFAALAEFERELIRERTNAGLAAARGRGNVGGRPATLDADKWRVVQALIRDGASVSEAARQVGVSRSAVYQKVKRAGGSGTTMPGGR